jgi:4-amino-4-deoxy-L-arabinose transferase-like glycosyltransferase
MARMTEPSLLDVLIAKLRFWRSPPDGLPSLRRLWSEEGSVEITEPGISDTPRQPRFRLDIRLRAGDGPPPLGMISALVLALVGLGMLSITEPRVPVAVVLLAGAAGALAFAVRRGETAEISDLDAKERPRWDPTFRPVLIAAAALAVAITAVAAAGNRLGVVVLAAWPVSVVLAALSVSSAPGGGRRWWRDADSLLRREKWGFAIPRSALLPVLIIAGAVAIRTASLATVPAEMVSVHAELLQAILRASTTSPIVFPWSGGGLGPVSVYLNAILAAAAGGPSFAIFKLGTVLAGLVTLPLVFALGREVGGRATGLAGMALAAVGHWPDLVSRTGFSDGWYPPFAAAALLLLVRGIRRTSRADFVGAGIVTGLAIQTTSMARSLVVLAVVLVAAVWIPATPEQRRRLAAGLALALVMTAVTGLPTLIADRSPPGDAGALWWLGAARGSIDHGVAPGLAARVGRTLVMPLWSDGPLWIHGGGQRPALDRAAAACFVLGIALTAVVAVHRRRANTAILLVLAMPLLMLPAILAPLDPELAPSPVRGCGALPAVFVLAGLGLATVAGAVRRSLAAPVGRRLGAATAIALLAASALAGRTVVHGSFAVSWDRSAWNASEMGSVVRAAITLGVPEDRAWVVPYPHWVDTRLVGAEAGLPGVDLAHDPMTVATTAGRPGAKLFLVHPDDHRTVRALRRRLPAAAVARQPSRVDGKEYLTVLDLTGGRGD